MKSDKVLLSVIVSEWFFVVEPVQHQRKGIPGSDDSTPGTDYREVKGNFEQAMGVGRFSP